MIYIGREGGEWIWWLLAGASLVLGVGLWVAGP